MQSQRITKPSAVAGGAAAAAHVPMNYLFIHTFGWGTRAPGWPRLGATASCSA